MHALSDRYNYLFRSTRGLVLVAMTMITLAAVTFGTLSGPMADLGIKDVTVRLLNLRLVEAEREGRIIILYHAIAMAVVAIEVYFITAIVPMKKDEQTRINSTVTVGYLAALIFGLLFAYFGYNWIFHGIYIFGLSLMFFGGLMLAKALWPWRKEYRVKDKAYAHTRGGVDLERVAFFTMAVATLGSALFGAVAGASFGNGFESFLAEDVVRQPHKTALQLAVIGHLHIMLTLIAVALALIVSRWLDFKGRMHQISMPLMIVGTIIVTLGVWLVVPAEEMAHYIIYAGSTVVMPAALMLVIHGFRKITAERLAEQKIAKPTRLQRLQALVHDPVKFGALWQLIYMNFVVTFVGIFTAIRLDKTIRMWQGREERIELTGHWHILSAVIATILLLYYVDLAGLKGRARRWFGWIVIVGSDLAFFAVTLFETKRLYVTESAQQPLVDWAMILTDAGLALTLLVIGLYLLARLVDLLSKRGAWRADVPAQEPPAAVEPRVQGVLQ